VIQPTSDSSLMPVSKVENAISVCSSGWGQSCNCYHTRPHVADSGVASRYRVSWKISRNFLWRISSHRPTAAALPGWGYGRWVAPSDDMKNSHTAITESRHGECRTPLNKPTRWAVQVVLWLPNLAVFAQQATGDILA